MHQTAFHYPELAGFKAEGTSQEAANAIEGSGQAARLRTAVLGWYATHESTADECAAGFGESILSIRPRCSELLKQGHLYVTGLRRNSSSGHSQNVLAMTPANERIAA